MRLSCGHSQGQTPKGVGGELYEMGRKAGGGGGEGKGGTWGGGNSVIVCVLNLRFPKIPKAVPTQGGCC